MERNDPLNEPDAVLLQELSSALSAVQTRSYATSQWGNSSMSCTELDATIRCAVQALTDVYIRLSTTQCTAVPAAEQQQDTGDRTSTCAEPVATIVDVVMNELHRVLSSAADLPGRLCWLAYGVLHELCGRRRSLPMALRHSFRGNLTKYSPSALMYFLLLLEAVHGGDLFIANLPILTSTWLVGELDTASPRSLVSQAAPEAGDESVRGAPHWLPRALIRRAPPRRACSEAEGGMLAPEDTKYTSFWMQPPLLIQRFTIAALAASFHNCALHTSAQETLLTSVLRFASNALIVVPAPVQLHVDAENVARTTCPHADATTDSATRKTRKGWSTLLAWRPKHPARSHRRDGGDTTTTLRYEPREPDGLRPCNELLTSFCLYGVVPNSPKTPSIWTFEQPKVTTSPASTATHPVALGVYHPPIHVVNSQVFSFLREILCALMAASPAPTDALHFKDFAAAACAYLVRVVRQAIHYIAMEEKDGRLALCAQFSPHYNERPLGACAVLQEGVTAHQNGHKGVHASAVRCTWTSRVFVCREAQGDISDDWTLLVLPRRNTSNTAKLVLGAAPDLISSPGGSGGRPAFSACIDEQHLLSVDVLSAGAMEAVDLMRVLLSCTARLMPEASGASGLIDLLRGQMIQCLHHCLPRMAGCPSSVPIHLATLEFLRECGQSHLRERLDTDRELSHLVASCIALGADAKVLHVTERLSAFLLRMMPDVTFALLPGIIKLAAAHPITAAADVLTLVAQAFSNADRPINQQEADAVVSTVLDLPEFGCVVQTLGSLYAGIRCACSCQSHESSRPALWRPISMAEATSMSCVNKGATTPRQAGKPYCSTARALAGYLRASRTSDLGSDVLESAPAELARLTA